VYTAVIKPASNLAENAEIMLQLPERSVEDVAQNDNIASDLLIRIYDSKKPSVNVSSSVGRNWVDGPFMVTVEFTEDVTELTSGMISVQNGSASELKAVNGSKRKYTALITPGEEGDVLVEVGANTVSDAANNSNTASNKLPHYYQKAAPTVTLTTKGSTAAVNGPFEVIFTFSKAVKQADIDVSRITVSRAAKGPLERVTDYVYTMLLTPNTEGVVTLTVAANAFKDESTRSNVTPAILSRTYDVKEPAGYALQFNRNSFDVINADQVKLQVSGAEIGTTYFYTITDVNNKEVLGTAAVSNGSFEISLPATLSTLADGVLIASFYLQDAAGNKGEDKKAKLTKETPDVDFVQRAPAKRVLLGTSFAQLNLPDELEVTYNTGSKEKLRVEWQKGTFKETEAKTYELVGDLIVPKGRTNNGKQAAITVEVYKNEVHNVAFVQSFAPIKVPVGTKLSQLPLPAKAEVVYSSQLKEELIIDWKQLAYNESAPGAYELSGDLVLPKDRTNTNGKKAVITVTVYKNEAPTSIRLSATSVRPDITVDEVIGTFTSVDKDDTQHLYSLVAGKGDAQNNLFEIRGDKLYLKQGSSLSGLTRFEIRVKSTDLQDNSLEQTFVLTLGKATGNGKGGETLVTELQLTNVFTPDGDGKNDTWTLPELKDYTHVEIEVFDRSGQRLYYATDPMAGWDGKNAAGQIQKGAYFYLVKVKDINLVKKGVVTILKK